MRSFALLLALMHSAAFAGGPQKCLPLIDKFLSQGGFGSFYKPAAAVSKSVSKEGVALFQSASGDQVEVTDSTIQVKPRAPSPSSPARPAVDVTYGPNCEISRVLLKTLEPTLITADQANCRRVRAERERLKAFSAASPLNFYDNWTLSLCDAYIPTETKMAAPGPAQPAQIGR